MIPLYDVSTHECSDEIQLAISNVLAHKQFILGPEVTTFEQRWAKYCSYWYAVSFGSGTCALEALIRSHNFENNSKIIVPVNTYSATAMAVCNAGHMPRFVDCNLEYGMDLGSFEDVIKKEHCVAVIPVHLYGCPENIREINKIAEQYGLIVIEDAAHAHGLCVPGVNDKMYSFYPTKNLGAFGDAGIAITNSEDRALWMQKWRNQGRETGNTTNHQIIGVNSRMDSLQAAVLNVKLDYLDIWNEWRRLNAKAYINNLSETDVILPPSDGVFHMFVIRVKDRYNVIKHLRQKGIGCSVHYPIPLHCQEAYRNLGYKHGDFPLADKLSQEILSIPMYPNLFLRPLELIDVYEAIRKVTNRR